MNDRRGTLETVARHLALAVQPLRAAVTDIESFRAFLFRLGWEVDSLPPSYTALGPLVDEAFAAVRDLPDGDEPSLDEVLSLLRKVRDVYRAVRDLTEAPDGVDATEFLGEIRERLFELLLVDYLATAVPKVYQVLVALGVITLDSHARGPDRPPFLRAHLRYDELVGVISDPLSIPNRVYGWGSDVLDTTSLFAHLREVIELTGALPSFGWVTEEVIAGYGAPGARRSRLELTLLETFVGEEPAKLAFELLGLPADGLHPAGLVLQPVLPPSADLEFRLSDTLRARIRPGTEPSELFGIVIRPGDVSVRSPLDPEHDLPAGGFGLSLILP